MQIVGDRQCASGVTTQDSLGSRKSAQKGTASAGPRFIYDRDLPVQQVVFEMPRRRREPSTLRSFPLLPATIWSFSSVRVRRRADPGCHPFQSSAPLCGRTFQFGGEGPEARLQLLPQDGSRGPFLSADRFSRKLPVPAMRCSFDKNNPSVPASCMAMGI